MKATWYSQTVASYRVTAWCHSTEDNELNFHDSENRKPHNSLTSFKQYSSVGMAKLVQYIILQYEITLTFDCRFYINI